MDNFRRPAGSSSKRKTLDGFVRPTRRNSSGQQSSVGGFRRVESYRPNENSRVGNFSQSDGYHTDDETYMSSGGAAALPLPHKNPPTRVKTPLFPRRKKSKAKQHSKRRFTIKRAILLFMLLLLGVGGYVGWKFYSNTSRVLDGGNLFGFFDDSAKLRGEDKGRVNILLAGNSSDDPGHGGALLTDSIMLVSIDTVNNSGFMLSIPRDLWVDYIVRDCSVGYRGKINAAYTCGEETNFSEAGQPDGGLGLLSKVIEENFGIDLDYHVNLNYTAFRDAVNAVGGIEVTIESEDPRGFYDANIAKVDGGPLRLTNGKQTLDGQTALNLARARGSTIGYGFTRSDHTRTENQRMMLLALKDRALSVGVLSNPAKITSLMDAAGNNVEADFEAKEVRRLYELSKVISNDSIRSVGLADEDVNLIQGFTTTNGLSAIRPVAGENDFTRIKAFMKKLMTHDPLVKEGATAVVLNASGITGLAQGHASELEEKGITVKAIGNAGVERTTTAVVAMRDVEKSATRAYFEKEYGMPPTTDVNAYPEVLNYEADFVIILGSNESNQVSSL